MNYRQIILAVLLFAPVSAGAEPVAALLKKAVALVCVEPPLAADAMAQALSKDARAASDEPLTMGEQKFGWRRQIILGGGRRLDITRLEPWGVLRRIEIQYRTGERPEIMVIADGDCAITAARRLRYGADGRAESIEMLGPDLTPTGDSEPLNPAVPPADDPGGITVALIDSGVNYLLPEINRRLARDGAGKLLGYDYWDMDDRPYDANPARSPFFPQRHGTRVASVILAEARATRLIPYRYPRPDLSRLKALVGDAVAHGARIVNLAMGSNKSEPWRAFAEAMAENPDVLFVVSAGNDGRDLDRRPVYPAAFRADNMLVITSADGFGDPARGSNWGRATVDLLVPGERVPVIDFFGQAAFASGASFAAPRVTALAVRLLEANPLWTAPDLKAAIIARARLVDGAGRLTSRYGFLDLDALPQ
ncbi:MAG: S8 family serine peptidase [Alphaproteobacteria bacterium]